MVEVLHYFKKRLTRIYFADWRRDDVYPKY